MSHRYDLEVLYRWDRIGPTTGDSEEWTPATPLRNAIGEPLFTFARIAEDANFMSIRHADDSAPTGYTVSYEERLEDPDFPEQLEQPERALSRWLRRHYRPETVLVER